jgi:hypothetical protein
MDHSYRVARQLGLMMLFGGLIGQGCSKSNESPPPSVEQPQSSIHWKIQWTSQCAGLRKEDCLGGYGFSVDSNGTYEVGPGPQGQLLTGKLSEEDLKSFHSHGHEEILATHSWVCESALEPAAEAAVATDQLKLIHSGQEREWIQSGVDSFCYALRDRKAACARYGRSPTGGIPVSALKGGNE